LQDKFITGRSAGGRTGAADYPDDGRSRRVFTLSANIGRGY